MKCLQYSLLAASATLISYFPFSSPASAFSFEFTPAGANIDGDPIRDIETKSGDIITFITHLDARDIAVNNVITRHTIKYDFKELQLMNGGPVPLTQNGSSRDPNGGGVDLLGEFIELELTNTVFIPAGQRDPIPLFEFRFTVMNPVNDGIKDFSLVPPQTVLEVIQGNTRMSQSSQVVEVQPEEFAFVRIPTPALLPGLLGMSVAALRKRKTAAQGDV